MCVFAATVADKLGLKLQDGQPVIVMGVGGLKTTYLHTVRLQLPGGAVNALVGFQDGLPVSGLLGMSGFFEHLRITFDGVAQTCEFERIPSQLS